jgi:hypothetical protein
MCAMPSVVTVIPVPLMMEVSALNAQQRGKFLWSPRKIPFRAACKSDSKNFFEFDHREGLDVKDDPLVAIAAMIPWELLRPKLKASLITGGLRASDVARKSPAGRKLWDEV